MKTTGKHIRLFEPSGCLSEKGLFGYLNHDLNVSERHAVEAHLSECLFCSDAMEGYEKHADKNYVAEEFSAIKAGAKFRLAGISGSDFKKKDNKRLLVFAVSFAAMFTVLVSGYYLFKNLPMSDKKQELAIENKVSKNDIPATKPLEEEQINSAAQEKSAKSETKPEITNKNLDFEEQKDESEKAVATGKKSLPETGKDYWTYKYSEGQTLGDGDAANQKDISGKADETISIPLGGNVKVEEKKSENGILVTKMPSSGGEAISVNSEINQKAVLKETKTRDVTKTVADKVETISTEDAEENVVVTSKNKQTKPNRKTQDAPVAAGSASNIRGATATPTLNEAIADYNAGNYSQALTEFETLLTQDKNNYAALYYSALCQYKTGQKENAITELDKLIKKKNNPFYELAMWQKAQIAEESSDKKQAVEIYREIIKINGTMKQSAIKKADELDK